MSVFSGDKRIVRAIRGQEVLFDQKEKHIYINLTKAHDKNKDSQIQSPNGENRIECNDDSILVTGDVNFGDNINVANIYLGDGKEILNESILRELKERIPGLPDDYKILISYEPLYPGDSLDHAVASLEAGVTTALTELTWVEI